MDYSKLADAILKISTQMEGIGLAVDEIKETLSKQRDSELARRLERLESSMKDQHIKLDALNAIDINPTLVVPTAPAAVRVAGAKSAVVAKKREDNLPVDEPQDVVDSKPDELKTFSNITEYFKFLWTVKRDLLYEKGVLTKEDYEKIYEDNKEKFDKKKKNEIILQKSIAFQIWKVLPQPAKDIVYAMKNQNINDVQKNNSTEIIEDDSEEMA